MNYTVTCVPAADQELAAAWLSARDRQAVTDAATEIDRLLRTNPGEQGESRDDDSRVLFVPPLGVQFRVFEPDRKVLIARFWSY